MTFFTFGVKCGGRGASGSSHGWRRRALIFAQKQRQRQTAEPDLASAQEMAAGDVQCLLNDAGVIAGFLHLFANISSRFKSTLLTTVQAAKSTASMPAGNRTQRLGSQFQRRPRDWPHSPCVLSGNNSDRRVSSPSLGGRVRQSRKPYAQLAFIGGAALLHYPPRQCLGRFDVNGIVERHQRLQRRVGARRG